MAAQWSAEALLARQDGQRHLRLVACGAVDDGKSTLIGRLLYESNLLFDDQLTELKADSRRRGMRADGLDFALLLDGLAAEREQRITIDVAYRFVETAQRSFVIADAPGHPQYTRNMVTAATSADLAVLLIDARKGLQEQSRRHSHLLSLFGVRHVVVAVNKMELVQYAEAAFGEIAREYAEFAGGLHFDSVACVPISALTGDNVTLPSAHMPWYRGPTLLDLLEAAQVRTEPLRAQPLRLPVQWVCRPGPDFRGFAGTVAAGVVRVGDAVRILPGGKTSTVARIVTAGGDLEHAVAGQAVTVTLADDIDASRGSVLCAAEAPLQCADQFECTLVWLDDHPALPGRTYLLKIATNTVSAQITHIKYEIDVGGPSHLAARQLAMNAIAVCNIGLAQPIPFDAYQHNGTLGGFVLIDRLSHKTVGAGMLHFALRRSQTLQPQALAVDKATRSTLKQQRPCVIWLTGHSGAGKSAIANAIEARLVAMGRHTYLLDGENVRQGLNKDLGFDAPGRVENIRRAAEVARMMVDAGLIVVAAFISPFRAEREMARGLVGPDEFVEVFVDAPLALAEERDPRGLYRKARRGELKNFTGVSLAYEAPARPEVRVDTTRMDPAAAVDMVVAVLRDKGVVAA